MGLWDCSPKVIKGLALQYQTMLRDCNLQSGTVCNLASVPRFSCLTAVSIRLFFAVLVWTLNYIDSRSSRH